MKTLLKLAVGAAIAGALVNMLMKQRAGNRSADDQAENFDEDVGLGNQGVGNQGVGEQGLGNQSMRYESTQGATVADTNGIGDEQSQRGDQPQDWRGAQNVLGS